MLLYIQDRIGQNVCLAEGPAFEAVIAYMYIKTTKFSHNHHIELKDILSVSNKNDNAMELQKTTCCMQ